MVHAAWGAGSVGCALLKKFDPAWLKPTRRSMLLRCFVSIILFFDDKHLHEQLCFVQTTKSARQDKFLCSCQGGGAVPVPPADPPPDVSTKMKVADSASRCGSMALQLPCFCTNIAPPCLFQGGPHHTDRCLQTGRRVVTTDAASPEGGAGANQRAAAHVSRQQEHLRAQGAVSSGSREIQGLEAGVPGGSTGTRASQGPFCLHPCPTEKSLPKICIAGTQF